MTIKDYPQCEKTDCRDYARRLRCYSSKSIFEPVKCYLPRRKLEEISEDEKLENERENPEKQLMIWRRLGLWARRKARKKN